MFSLRNKLKISFVILRNRIYSSIHSPSHINPYADCQNKVLNIFGSTYEEKMKNILNIGKK